LRSTGVRSGCQTSVVSTYREEALKPQAHHRARVIALLSDYAAALQSENQHRGLPQARDLFGNPFRPVTFSPAWHTDTAVSLADEIYRVASRLSALRESIPIPNDGVYCPVCHIANIDLGRLRTPCPQCGRALLKFGWD
jgi:hypothetical protein